MKKRSLNPRRRILCVSATYPLFRQTDRQAYKDTPSWNSIYSLDCRLANQVILISQLIYIGESGLHCSKKLFSFCKKTIFCSVVESYLEHLSLLIIGSSIYDSIFVVKSFISDSSDITHRHWQPLSRARGPFVSGWTLMLFASSNLLKEENRRKGNKMVGDPGYDPSHHAVMSSRPSHLAHPPRWIGAPSRIRTDTVRILSPLTLTCWPTGAICDSI